jgi:hypothetical protein
VNERIGDGYQMKGSWMKDEEMKRKREEMQGKMRGVRGVL